MRATRLLHASVIACLISLGGAACASSSPPPRTDDTSAGASPTTPIVPQPSARRDRLLAAEDLPLAGWVETYTDSAEIPARTAQPCGLEIDPLLGDPDADFASAAVRAWTVAAEPPSAARLRITVVASPDAERGVRAARAAVAECPHNVESASEFGRMTLVPAGVAVPAGRTGFCANYLLEQYQLGPMLGVTCHVADADHRVEIELLTPEDAPVADADLQAVVDLAVETALTP